MCGIVGLTAPTFSNDELRARVDAMCARIVHRGPDEGGVTSEAGVALGMRRLSIIDIAHGHQPMFSRDGRISLVYNGEIYNAPALRKRLIAKGVRFDTRCDTEVLLRLYEENPEDVEEHLVGMWAFAIHDRKRGKLVLSRDRFGIKPLFVAARGRSVAFASELRAFDRTFAPLESCFRVDRSAAHAMLTWSYVPENETIFGGVERVPPSTRLTFDLETGERHARTYWRVRPSSDAAAVRSLDEACEMVDRVLAQAVKEHLESDVPIATFLSGGVDSSLVTSYAARTGKVTAFTIGFREPRFDESPFARATAHKLGVPIEVAILDRDAARKDLGTVLAAYDEPFGDSSSIATHMLSRHVGAKFKVALAGDGGDEAFAGYRKYGIIRIRRSLGRVPLALPLAAGVLGLLPHRSDRTSAVADLLRAVGKARHGLVASDAEAYVALTQVATLSETLPLVQGGGTDATRFVSRACQRFEEAVGSPLQRTLAADVWNPLPNDMLTKVDRASMACSLEARVPFLDHRVVEIGAGLPERFVLDARGKRVLRALHERRFGRVLARRKKQGFGVPVESWLRTNLASACDELFRPERLERFGLLAPQTLSNGRHRELLARAPMLLWHAFSLAAWCESALGDGPEALQQILK